MGVREIHVHCQPLEHIAVDICPHSRTAEICLVHDSLFVSVGRGDEIPELVVTVRKGKLVILVDTCVEEFIIPVGVPVLVIRDCRHGAGDFGKFLHQLLVLLGIQGFYLLAEERDSGIRVERHCRLA